jgi:RNA polymerase sigma-70 factor (ECF subfamily)
MDADKATNLAADAIADHSAADDAVRACYAEDAAGLERYARSLVRDPDAAADVCQEVFLRLLVVSRSGRMPDAPAAWMHRVAHNLVVSDVRKRQTTLRIVQRLGNEDDELGASIEETILRRERDAGIAAALGSISSDDRTAVLLAAQGYRSSEIGRQIGRTELATRALICRARGRLRMELGEAASA